LEKFGKVWNLQCTCEMNAALLNRYILAELLFCKLEEGPAAVTRRLIMGEALDFLLFHVATKSIESSAIVLLDQHTKLVPTNGAHAWLDQIECCVQGFSDGSLSPFIRFRSFAVCNHKINGIELCTQGSHTETKHCNALLTKPNKQSKFMKISDVKAVESGRSRAADSD
jgi:hypothetical protein